MIAPPPRAPPPLTLVHNYDWLRAGPQQLSARPAHSPGSWPQQNAGLGSPGAATASMPFRGANPHRKPTGWGSTTGCGSWGSTTIPTTLVPTTVAPRMPPLPPSSGPPAPPMAVGAPLAAPHHPMTSGTVHNIASMMPPPPPAASTGAPVRTSAIPGGVHSVILYKSDAGAKLGLTLTSVGTGGDDGCGPLPPRVKALAPGLIASQAAGLQVGQMLLSVNGVRVDGHEHATQLLKAASGRLVLKLLNDDTPLQQSPVAAPPQQLPPRSNASPIKSPGSGAGSKDTHGAKGKNAPKAAGAAPAAGRVRPISTGAPPPAVSPPAEDARRAAPYFEAARELTSATGRLKEVQAQLKTIEVSTAPFLPAHAPCAVVPA